MTSNHQVAGSNPAGGADPQITPDTQKIRVSLLGLPGPPAGGLRSGPLGGDELRGHHVASLTPQGPLID